MSIPKESLLVLAIFCWVAILQCKSAAGLATSSRSFAYPGHHVTRDYDSFADEDGDSLVYAYCADDAKSDLRRECSVVSERRVFADKPRRRVCNATLLAEGEGNVVDRYFLGVAAFGADGAILQWLVKRDPGLRGAQNAEKHYKLSIVDFSDCSVAKQAGVVVKEFDPLRGLLSQTNLIAYERTFDAVYPNRELCSGRKVCRQTFDAEGKPVGQPVAWFSHDSLFAPILPIRRRSDALGHAIFEMYRQEKIVSISRDNEVKLLEKIPHVNFASVHSAAHEMIGVCSRRADKSLVCRQFDSRGSLKLNTTLQLDHPVRFFMHNLPRGGFLLLVERLIECPPEDKQCESNNNSNDNEHRVIKYDANGKEAGSIKFAGLDCADKRMVQWKKVFDTKDNGYCVSNMCLFDFRMPGNRERFDLTTKCFKEKELVKSSSSFSLSSWFG